ncbi:MAG: inorganic phosphate transporter [Promethearchaeota archaeon]
MKLIALMSIILAMFLAFGIGSNDETTAPIIGAKAIRLKITVFIGGILAFAGCFFLSAGVGKTIGKSLLGEAVVYTTDMMLAIVCSTALWLVLASRTGAPISTTHSVVGAVFGISIVWIFQNRESYSFIDAINWLKLGQVALGWVISPLFGMLGAILIQYLLVKILRKKYNGLNKIERIEKLFVYLLIISVFWTEFSRGGNDAANAIGIFYGLEKSGDISATAIPFLLALAGIFIAFGLNVIGKNVVANVGTGLVEMRPSDAFVISISTTIVVFVCTILGLPISGTHVLIFAIIGSGLIKGEKPNKRSFRNMVLSWLFTFPAAAMLSALFYGILIFL